ncbi:MAG: patatin-like phospholipase family protein [Treponema sp.]|nr:patatin-like phospholipase family protein [Treponema sp.]
MRKHKIPDEILHIEKKIFFIITLILCLNYTFAEENSKKENLKRPKVALVLSGGGANGLAEIPLLEAIEAEGIEPDLVIGVSMGAIIGSLYASGYSPKQIRELMINIDIPALINQSASSAKALSPQNFNPFYSNFASVTFSKDGIGSQPGLIGDQKITNMLATCLSKTSHIRNFDNFPKQFRSVSTDVFSGEQIISSSGSLIKAVRGSMAVPMVFSPFPTDNKSLAYDGGLSNNLPIQLAKDMGADVVIAMDVLGKIAVEQKDFNTINSSLVQSINLLISSNTLSQYQNADILIRPDLSTITAAAFGHVEEIIAVGEKAVEDYKSHIHELALELQENGFPLKELDYNRKSLYDSLPDPYIESISIEDISNSQAAILPKASDLKIFEERILDENTKKRLVARLEQLRYTYNLSTLTYELRMEKEEKISESSENHAELVILANHYAQPTDRFFIGGRPALECNVSKEGGAEFIMLPFFTAGLIITDILPLNLTFTSDKFFCGSISYEPLLFKNNDVSIKAKITGAAKYGALHPQKYLTYSTLLADDDFGFFADAGANIFHAEWMTGGAGILYDFTYLHLGKKALHNLSFYAKYSINTLQDYIRGLEGSRLDAKIDIGTDFKGNFFYAADFFMLRNYELINDINSLGFETKLVINAWPSALIQGYTDFGGFDGMCGYGYGSLKAAGFFTGLSYRHVLFSIADVPLLVIAKTKVGLFDGEDAYLQSKLKKTSAKNPFDTNWNFDAGSAIYFSIGSPVGNLILGGSYAFVSQKWSFMIGFM